MTRYYLDIMTEKSHEIRMIWLHLDKLVKERNLTDCLGFIHELQNLEGEYIEAENSFKEEKKRKNI